MLHFRQWMAPRGVFSRAFLRLSSTILSSFKYISTAFPARSALIIAVFISTSSVSLEMDFVDESSNDLGTNPYVKPHPTIDTRIFCLFSIKTPNRSSSVVNIGAGTTTRPAVPIPPKGSKIIFRLCWSTMIRICRHLSPFSSAVWNLSVIFNLSAISLLFWIVCLRDHSILLILLSMLNEEEDEDAFHSLSLHKLEGVNRMSKGRAMFLRAFSVVHTMV